MMYGINGYILLRRRKIFRDPVSKKCYRPKKIFRFLFSIISGLEISIILLLFFIVPNFFGSLLVALIIAIILWILFELFIALILRVEEVPCWEKRLQEMKSSPEP